MDYVKTLAEVKKSLLELIEEFEQDLEQRKVRLERLRTLNRLIDEALVKTSFKKAIEVAHGTKAFASRITDKDDRSIVYATVTEKENEIIVTPAPGKLYSIDHSAFKQFLLGKVLDPPQNEDAKKVEKGILSIEEAFTYNLEFDDNRNLIRLIIRNIHDDNESRRIFGALRWTFAKIASSS
ncbi:MAG: hypothetical protein ACTSW4_00175 [Candidatus Ranarchaeia archaeon]